MTNRAHKDAETRHTRGTGRRVRPEATSVLTETTGPAATTGPGRWRMPRRSPRRTGTTTCVRVAELENFRKRVTR